MNLQIVVDALFVIITCGVYYAWKVYIKPWLEDHHLVQAADVAVRAVQAIYGRYNGQQKLQHCLDMLAEQGWDINADQVVAAVKAAWLKLDTQQIVAGIKTVQ